jgi:hypothetical protein
MVSGMAGLLGRPYVVISVGRLGAGVRKVVAGDDPTRLGAAWLRCHCPADRHRYRAARDEFASVVIRFGSLTAALLVQPGAFRTHLWD